MDLILDTCGLLSLSGLAERKLSSRCLQAIEDSRGLFLSSCSLFELSIKLKRKQLKLTPFHDAKSYWQRAIQTYEIEVIPVSDLDFYRSVQLEDFHSDPFDRIIISQSQSRKLQIVTYDGKFGDYAVTTLC